MCRSVYRRRSKEELKIQNRDGYPSFLSCQVALKTVNTLLVSLLMTNIIVSKKSERKVFQTPTKSFWRPLSELDEDDGLGKEVACICIAEQLDAGERCRWEQGCFLNASGGFLFSPIYGVVARQREKRIVLWKIHEYGKRNLSVHRPVFNITFETL